MRQLSDAISEFDDSSSGQSISSYLLYYLNTLEKTQPRMFFQET
jgi:hypothetical protein